MKTEEKPIVASAIKDPQTRILDMLIGWAEFVYQQEDEHSDSLRGDAIHDLYQEFAGTLEQYDEKTSEECEVLARQFLESRVLPKLLHGA